jgi:hypothetical protein
MGFFDAPIVANPDEANTGGERKPLPVGEYQFLIEESKLGLNKKQKEMLTLKFKVDKGEHEGKVVFHNFNLEHDNEQVVNIAKAQLHALLILTGLKEITHPDELVGHTFTAKVGIKKRTDPGTGQERIDNAVYLAIKKGAEAPTSNAAPAPPTTTAPRASKTSKW